MSYELFRNFSLIHFCLTVEMIKNIVIFFFNNDETFINF